MLQVARRDLEDARVPGLSSDRRFLIAYDAALTLATIPLLCAGYETHGAGHHWLVFHLLPEVMGPEARDLAGYLETCRTKRNIGTYHRGGQISAGEADELLQEAAQFHWQIKAWLQAHFPQFIE